MTLTERLSKLAGPPAAVAPATKQRARLVDSLAGLAGPPASIAPDKPTRSSLSTRLESLAGLPAAVAVQKPPRPTLLERFANLGGQARPISAAPASRTSLMERLANLGGEARPISAAPAGRVSLMERLGQLSGPPAAVGVETAPRTSLAPRLEAVAGMAGVPAPAVPSKPTLGLHDRMVQIYDTLRATTPQWRTLPFGDWLPDLPDLFNPGATIAKNVFPASNSYRPLGALAASTDALDTAALGAAFGQDSSGNHFNYAGDAAKLYSVGAAGVTDKSKGGGYSTASGEVWEAVLFGTTMIFSNFFDAVQGITVGSAGLFADQITSTLTPKFRHLAVVREFLVGGNSNDGTDGDVPHRTWWSGYKDPTDFDPDAQTQCDFEDRPAAGWVQKVVGGVEYGLIFQQQAVTRMSYAGGDTIFQFDSIDRKRGTPVPNSVIGHGRRVYFISEEGFFVTDGAQTYPIGANQVDKTFWGQFDVADRQQVSAAIDPLNKLVAWSFPGAGGVGKIFFYDWQNRRWSEAEVELEILYNSTSEAFTLEGLDAVALDSGYDTTISVNEAGGQTVLSVTSVAGAAVDDTVRITLNDATIHQANVDAVGGSDITIDVALPSAADAGNRVVRTTIDALSPGLDSPQWQGGGLLFGAFDTDHKLGAFDGANLAATIETGEVELNPGFLSKLVKSRPLIDGGTITGAVCGRNRLIDAIVFDPSAPLDDIGEIGMLNESRYHRIRAQVAAGGTWQHAQGVQVDASSMGTR